MAGTTVPVRLDLIVDGKTTQATLKLTEEQVRRLGLASEQTGAQMGAAFARGAGVAESSMQDAVKAVQQLQQGTLQSIKQVDEAIRHLEAARNQATTEAGRGLFNGMIEQARTVRQGFVQVGDAADGMAAAQAKARIAGQQLGYMLNDTQQFAFGFQQGVIAISNNLPMLVDQLSDVARTSGGARAALSAMVGALTGPAGILTLVSLGVVAFGAFSSAQERSRAATDKQTEALRKQEEQVRDNITALREMSGAALAAQQGRVTAQVSMLEAQLEALRAEREQIERQKQEQFVDVFDPATNSVRRVQKAASAEGERLAVENAARVTEIKAQEAQIQQQLNLLYGERNAADQAVLKDLDAQIAALKQQEEQIIRNNQLSEEERQAQLRALRAQVAELEKERELRAGPSDKALRDAEKAVDEERQRRLERQRLEAEQLEDATERAVALIQHRFEVERAELRDTFGGQEQYAEFLEGQIERLNRLERAAVAAARAPKITERARPEAALPDVDVSGSELPQLDVPTTIGVVEYRLRQLREGLKNATTDEGRAFFRVQIEGWEKIREAMEGGRTELMEWQDALDLIQQGFRMIVDAQRAADEARMSAIERRRDAELDAIDAQIEAEARRGQVMTEQEARREVLLQKRRQIEQNHDEELRRERQRQAEAEKQRALFQIAINTAVAVSKVWGQTGIFGIAAQWPVLAMGAAQAALVASQSVPKFARGVDGYRGGMALVGEEGPELVTLGSGSNVLTNRNTEALLGLMAGASRARPAPSSTMVTEASMERAFARALSTAELRATGRNLSLVQAREQRLVDKAGLR